MNIITGGSKGLGKAFLKSLKMDEKDWIDLSRSSGCDIKSKHFIFFGKDSNLLFCAASEGEDNLDITNAHIHMAEKSIGAVITAVSTVDLGLYPNDIDPVYLASKAALETYVLTKSKRNKVYRCPLIKTDRYNPNGKGKPIPMSIAVEGLKHCLNSSYGGIYYYEDMYPIYLGSDLKGKELKDSLINYLQENGYITESFFNENYPKVVEQVASRVQKGGRGILVCGTGIGMQVSANKFKGITAVIPQTPYQVERSVLSNNSNILCFGGEVQTKQTSLDILKQWLPLRYQGGSDHKLKLIKEKELT